MSYAGQVGNKICSIVHVLALTNIHARTHTQGDAHEDVHL